MFGMHFSLTVTNYFLPYLRELGCRWQGHCNFFLTGAHTSTPDRIIKEDFKEETAQTRKGDSLGNNT